MALRITAGGWFPKSPARQAWMPMHIPSPFCRSSCSSSAESADGDLREWRTSIAIETSSDSFERWPETPSMIIIKPYSASSIPLTTAARPFESR
jgi:hypothetical protein